MDNFRYSDYPMEAYRLPIAMDEVAVIKNLGTRDQLPTWNLFWLSQPRLDAVPSAGSNWHRVYMPVSGLLVSVLKDVLDRGDLARSVVNHPSTFMEWFSNQDHAEFRTYDVAGRIQWIDNVMERAQRAADAMIKLRPVRYTPDGKLQFT